MSCKRGLVTLNQVRPATYIGNGKVDEIAGLVKSLEASVVVMDCPVSPVQQRNLEKAWGAKVIDRTGLILEIFGRRARTREGALQVELAHLTYQKSRLVRSWTHLERQRGGFGFLGGPGETQLEADRRVIEDRIEPHRGRARQGQAHAQAASRQPQARAVSDRGAGRLHQCRQVDAVQPHDAASVLSADMLFATLDPTLRAVALPHGNRIILSDTVGFISDLPTMLVAAFRATLEEVIEADVILHVRDMSHEDAEAQSHDVEKVLAELGIEAADPRLIEVWNKIDRLDAEARARLFNLAERQTGYAPADPGIGVERGRARSPDCRNRNAARRKAADAGTGARSGRRRGLELALSPFRGAVERHARRRPAGGDHARADAENTARVRAKFPALTVSFSAALAASQSASISARVASFGVLPRAASARSIEAKRRSNFRLVWRSTSSGSAPKWRARLTTANSRSPTSAATLALVGAVELGFDLVGFLADFGQNARAGRSSRSRRGRPCPAASGAG